MNIQKTSRINGTKSVPNQFVKQHADFCAWIVRDRDTMPAELLAAAERFKCALWAAAHNSKPLPGFTDELATFMRAKTQTAPHRPSEHPH